MRASRNDRGWLFSFDMPKFRILINGSTVQNGLMEPMSFANYAAAELYARRHFAKSPDVFSIVIVTESTINNQ